MNRLALLLTVILVVVAAGGGYYLFAVRGPSGDQPSGGAIEEIVPPEATGDIGDTVDALLLEAADESYLFDDEEGDADLVGTDSGEVDDLGQSINEDEL